MKRRVYELWKASYDDIGDLEEARLNMEIAKDSCELWGLTDYVGAFQDAYDEFDERINALYEEEEANELADRNALNRADGFPPLTRFIA
jgi:hypothetical protein